MTLEGLLLRKIRFQFPDSGMGMNIRNGYRHAKGLGQNRGQPDRSNGIQARFLKGGDNAEASMAHDSGQALEKLSLPIVFCGGFSIFLTGKNGFWKGKAIQLSIGVYGKFVQTDKTRRNHISGEMAGKNILREKNRLPIRLLRQNQQPVFVRR